MEHVKAGGKNFVEDILSIVRTASSIQTSLGKIIKTFSPTWQPSRPPRLLTNFTIWMTEMSPHTDFTDIHNIFFFGTHSPYQVTSPITT